MEMVEESKQLALYQEKRDHESLRMGSILGEISSRCMKPHNGAVTHSVSHTDQPAEGLRSSQSVLGAQELSNGTLTRYFPARNSETRHAHSHARDDLGMPYPFPVWSNC